MNQPELMPTEVRGSFVETQRGRLFAVEFGQSSWPQVVVVHGFGDEMNKSRSAITALAGRLTSIQTGLACLDPFGTGDSDGDFADADIDLWIEDISAYLAANSNCCALLGVRFGCALLADVRSRQDRLLPFYCWSPQWDAVKSIRDLLRAKSLSLMMSGVKQSAKSFVEMLENGQSVEAGGYEISPAMWQSAIRLSERLDIPEDAQTFELGTGEAGGNGTFVDDLPFWNSAELRVPEKLIEATIAEFSRNQIR